MKILVEQLLCPVIEWPISSTITEELYHSVSPVKSGTAIEQQRCHSNT